MKNMKKIALFLLVSSFLAEAGTFNGVTQMTAAVIGGSVQQVVASVEVAEQLIEGVKNATPEDIEQAGYVMGAAGQFALSTLKGAANLTLDAGKAVVEFGKNHGPTVCKKAEIELTKLANASKPLIIEGAAKVAHSINYSIDNGPQATATMLDLLHQAAQKYPRLVSTGALVLAVPITYYTVKVTFRVTRYVASWFI